MVFIFYFFLLFSCFYLEEQQRYWFLVKTFYFTTLLVLNNYKLWFYIRAIGIFYLLFQKKIDSLRKQRIMFWLFKGYWLLAHILDPYCRACSRRTMLPAFVFPSHFRVQFEVKSFELSKAQQICSLFLPWPYAPSTI
jgi:hypothetical protein